MTNRKRFFYNGILLTLVGLAMRSVGMFFGAFVSRAVGAEGVGLYTLIMTVYSFALTLATSGVGITVTRHVAASVAEEGEGSEGGVMLGAFIYALVFGICSFSLLFFGAEFIGLRIIHDGRTVASFKILALSLIPNALSSVLCGYFVGVKRVFANAAVQVASNIFKIAITVILVFANLTENIGKSVFYICLGMTLTELLSFVALLVQYLIFRSAGGRRQNELREISKTAMPLAFSAYVRSALLTLEHILIPKKLREYRSDAKEALSDYGTLHGMALPIVMFPMAPLSSFAGLLVPEFAGGMASGDSKRVSRICSESIGATLSYATVISVFLLLFSEELGYIIYSSYEAGRFISVLAPIVPIMYLDHVTDAILKGIGEQVYSMWVNIADSFLSVVLVCLLIPKLGILGYAVVIIIMEAFNFALSFLRLKRKISFSLAALKNILSPLISAVVASCLTDRLFAMNGSCTSALWLVMKIVFTVAAFIGTNTVLSAVCRAVLEKAVKLFQKRKMQTKDGIKAKNKPAT